mmetsp:Transcript_67513/g.162035  ORF Transcript_67513/g.162035 Transcript_67513/m.162035 type:complete len:125 (+) Transcript_67513:384-758(+)
MAGLPVYQGSRWPADTGKRGPGLDSVRAGLPTLCSPGEGHGLGLSGRALLTSGAGGRGLEEACQHRRRQLSYGGGTAWAPLSSVHSNALSDHSDALNAVHAGSRRVRPTEKFNGAWPTLAMLTC